MFAKISALIDLLFADQFDFYNDFFATDVIAKDPYSGRPFLLIDSRG